MPAESLSSPADALRRLRQIPETAPLALVLFMVWAVFALNHFAHLPFVFSDAQLLTPLLIAAPLYALAARTRELRALGEIAFYFALYWTFSICAVRLTFLGFHAGFPVQDETFARADAALGFDWGAWAALLRAHPFWLDLLTYCYKSHIWQAPAAICLLALFVPRKGNAFLLTALALGALATVLVMTLWPSIGPAPSFGSPLPWAHVLRDLRAQGPIAPLPLAGIVAFPSFHTTMAIAYTAAYRRLPLLLVPAGVLNLMMLVAVPFTGDHYVVDIAGGAMVAAAALWISDRIGRGTVAAPAPALTRAVETAAA